MMASEAKVLSPDEFASLLLVGYTPATNRPPAVIPPEHSTRLIALGNMADIAGRLRMTHTGQNPHRCRTNCQLRRALLVDLESFCSSQAGR
jgi:hypothetical protein